MASEFYYDARLLRDHVSQVHEERRTTQHLREAVRRARDYGDPSLASEYNRVLNTVDHLEQYFRRMATVLDDAASDVNQTYQEVVRIIEEDVYQLRRESDIIEI